MPLALPSTWLPEGILPLACKSGDCQKLAIRMSIHAGSGLGVGLITPLRALTSAEELGRRGRVTDGVRREERSPGSGKATSTEKRGLIYQSPPKSSQSSLAFSQHKLCCVNVG